MRGRSNAILLFLMADGCMFLALFAVYGYLRTAAATWPVAIHFPSLLMAFAMTMFAVSASVMMEVAKRADVESVGRWVALAVGGWLCVLFLEAMDLARLLFFDSGEPIVFMECFFGLSIFYITHLLAGVVYLCVTGARRRGLDAATYFVHFVNAMWLILFFGLYVSGGDLRGL